MFAASCRPFCAGFNGTAIRGIPSAITPRQTRHRPGGRRLGELLHGSLTSRAAAATGIDTWVGATSAWSSGANWGGTNTPPASADSLVFAAAGAGGLNLNDDLTSTSFNVAGITFNSGAGAFVIGNGGATANAGNAFALTGDITNNSTSLETINNPFSVASLQNFATAGGGNLTLAGVVSGAGGIVASGNGTLTLTASSTYTGPTIVDAGRVLFQNNKSNGNNFTVAAGATVELNTSSTLTFGTGTLTGTGTFVKTGSGSVIFGASQQIFNISMGGGLIDVQGGTLRNDFGAGTWTYNKASLNVATGATVDLWDSAGGITVDALTGNGTVTHTSFGIAENFTVGSNNGSGTFSGVISDNSFHVLNFAKIGSGTQILSGNLSYQGTTAVSAGTLQLNTSTAKANVLPATGAVSLAGGNLCIQNQNASGGAAVTQTVGTFSVDTNGGGAITLGNSNGALGSSLTTGAFTRNAGSTLAVNLVNAGTGALTIGSTLSQTGGIFGWAVVTDSTGTGFGTQNGGSQIVRYAGASTLAATGAVSTTNYTTTPGVDPAYTANTLQLASGGASANSLAISTATSAGVLDLNAGTLTLTSGGLLMTGSNSYTIQNGQLGANGGELDLHQFGTGMLTISGTLSGGAGTVVKAGSGTVILTGTNLYTGPTNVTGGTLQLGTGTTTGSLSTLGTITLSGGNLTFNRSDPIAQGTNFSAAIISGAGSIIQAGSGTTLLNVNNMYSGGTVISAGTLKFNRAKALGTGSIWLGAGASDATLNYNGDNGDGHLSGAGVPNAINVGGTGVSTITATSFNAIFSGPITLANNLTISGNNNAGSGSNLTTTAAITGTGNLTTFSNGSASEVFLQGPVNNLGTITSTGGAGGTAISGNIGPNVTGVIQNGTVALVLSAANNYAGPTTINSGTLRATTPLARPPVPATSAQQQEHPATPGEDLAAMERSPATSRLRLAQRQARRHHRSRRR